MEKLQALRKTYAQALWREEDLKDQKRPQWLEERQQDGRDSSSLRSEKRWREEMRKAPDHVGLG